VVTDAQTNTPANEQTHRQDRLQYTALQLACSVINSVELPSYINSRHYVVKVHIVKSKKNYIPSKNHTSPDHEFL